MSDSLLGKVSFNEQSLKATFTVVSIHYSAASTHHKQFIAQLICNLGFNLKVMAVGI